jgi:hypothetical protein
VGRGGVDGPAPRTGWATPTRIRCASWSDREEPPLAYPSVDKLQNMLAAEVFGYAADRKKASGRALGTLVEIVTFYTLCA